VALYHQDHAPFLYLRTGVDTLDTLLSVFGVDIVDGNGVRSVDTNFYRDASRWYIKCIEADDCG
jgi:hypothetical protein